MQPLDRPQARDSDFPGSPGERPSAEIIWLDDWRRRHRPRPAFRWRRAQPLPLGEARPRGAPPATRRRVPIEAWLMALIVFSAMAGAMFALMGLGYLP